MPRVNIPEERLVPEGEYLAVVEAIDTKETQAHDEMWKMRLAIAEGEYEGEYEGETVTDNLVFSSAAFKRLRIVAKAFGLATKGDVDFNQDDLLGKRVRITVVHEEYKGQMQAKISFGGYKQAPPPPVKAPAADPVAQRFQGNSAKPVREPGEDRDPLPAHDEPPLDADIPF